MPDQHDEDERSGSVTTKVQEMQGSGSNEEHSPSSAHTDRGGSDAHPKKKRKVNHGQHAPATFSETRH